MESSVASVVFWTLLVLGSCCNSPFTEVGSKCALFLSSLHLDYESSEGICSDLGGKLMKIDNPNFHLDLVQYIENDESILTSYWIDGKVSGEKWVYSDGTDIPRGTPYWATYLKENNQLEQQPGEDLSEDMCLAIEDGSSYYFIPSASGNLKSPLCEELTGTAATATASSAIIVRDACGGGELTAFAGEITTPQYPDGYPDASPPCVWTINRGDSGDAVIRITIQDLDLSGPDGNYGRLIISDGPDGSPILGYYDCDNLPATPFDLVTSGPTAWIQFYSFHDVTDHRGFDLQYISVCRSDWEDRSCGAAYNSSTGSIVSPCFPYSNYPLNLDCSWTIEVEDDKFISLTVFSFDTQANHDVVQIRDGLLLDSPLLSELSGIKETGYEISSSGNLLHISFTSDSSVPGPGFSFLWTSKKLCPAPYLNIGQMCLHLILSPHNYGLSNIACEEAAGKLAAINDPQDLRDLYLYLHDKGIDDNSFWLGGSDAEQEGLWKWVDSNNMVPSGTPFWGTSGYNSETQEPDGGEDENCLLLASNGFHFFRDANCSTEALAICMH